MQHVRDAFWHMHTLIKAQCPVHHQLIAFLLKLGSTKGIQTAGIL
jgi:hypothetical protein